MNNTPKGKRLHIALLGRTNVCKSSLLNLMLDQDIAVTSLVAGTTTDIVEKAIELLPLRPVLFLDTPVLMMSRVIRRTAEKTSKSLTVTISSLWLQRLIHGRILLDFAFRFTIGIKLREKEKRVLLFSCNNYIYSR